MNNYPDKILGIPRGWIIIIWGLLFSSYKLILTNLLFIFYDSLTQSFDLDTGSFSTMTFFYLLPFSLSLYPAGIAIDKFGAGKFTVWGTLICAFSCHLFAATTSFSVICSSLSLFGIGSAIGILGVIKLGIIWSPAARIARIVAAILILKYLSNFFIGFINLSFMAIKEWQTALHVLGLIGWVLSLLIYYIVRYLDRPLNNSQNTIQ